MKYRIVIAKDGASLEEEVNRLIAEGWEPLGGVAIDNSYDRHYFSCAQAMIIRRKR